MSVEKPADSAPKYVQHAIANADIRVHANKLAAKQSANPETRYSIEASSLAKENPEEEPRDEAALAKGDFRCLYGAGRPDDPASNMSRQDTLRATVFELACGFKCGVHREENSWKTSIGTATDDSLLVLKREVREAKKKKRVRRRDDRSGRRITGTPRAMRGATARAPHPPPPPPSRAGIGARTDGECMRVRMGVGDHMTRSGSASTTGRRTPDEVKDTADDKDMGIRAVDVALLCSEAEALAETRCDGDACGHMDTKNGRSSLRRSSRAPMHQGCRRCHSGRSERDGGQRSHGDGGLVDAAANAKDIAHCAASL
ncbi:hypothetical protein B0H14DRAFT_2603353 [Mycena olivaceomarginata]|nr:hypothetical protein B0H14DRAFT_2603353 [Mycena olivaceomarginata]